MTLVLSDWCKEVKMNKQNPQVGILMGSESDLEIMKSASAILDDFGVPYEIRISSAHRTPKETIAYAEEAAGRGIKVLIAGAGHAAHLAGVLAANTTLPVIGVPIDSSALKGMDSLLATVQMPGGIPVASMAIGKSGAKNAGIFAVQVLAVHDLELKQRLHDSRKKMAEKVREQNNKISSS
jgi:phosphoribosylaminoimidazole carboxylase PurE protein